MNRVRAIMLVCAIALVFGARLVTAGATLKVNETATKLALVDEGAAVALALDNPTGREIPAHIKLELLDPQNRVRATSERDQSIGLGSTTPTVRLALKLTNAEKQDLLWYRLRYEVTPGPAAGTLSLSEITPGLFAISILSPAIAVEGTRLGVKARATHPITNRPQSGVRVEGVIEIDDDPQSAIETSGVTDAEGFAALGFDLPRGIHHQGSKVTVYGQRDGLTAEASTQLLIDHYRRIGISTDKPMYQPGQTLHVRTLAFKPSRQAANDAELTLKILDPEETVVYRATLKPSRFGIASADWTIPENVRLGDYTIHCQTDESRDDEPMTSPYTVRISRYQLPNFAVTVKPNRPFYLSAQNAEVEVRGDYLFGQPLKRGHVRVVCETSREWNYREQKWEIDEEEKYEGELDAAGRFVAHIDLRKAYAELAENDYQRFKDSSYTAYVTDASTGRTEQRRFDLRATKEAIHAYVIEKRPRTAGALEFYVSTFYADGTPAECAVTVGEVSAPDEAPSPKLERRGQTIRTNRYGVAKVTNFTLTKSRDEEHRWYVRLAARDRNGQTGHHTHWLELSQNKTLRVDTDRTIYRAGNAVQVRIASSEPDTTVFVEARQDNKTIRSESVRLIKGEGSLALPYKSDFKDEVTIAAFAFDRAGDLQAGYHKVLYPRDHELKLDVRMDAATYRPGQEARAVFQARTADGREVESALGIAVVDRAVDQRARTDAESANGRNYYASMQGMWGGNESLGGVTRRDFDKLDLSKPVPADLDLVAEIMFNAEGHYYNYERGNESQTSLDQAFHSVIEAQLKPVREALGAHYLKTREYPQSEAQLALLLTRSGVEAGVMRDPWGTAYRTAFEVIKGNQVMRLISAGPDKRPGTDDDFEADHINWPYFRALGEKFDRAIDDYQQRLGRFIRNRATLANGLQQSGIKVKALKDPWGKPYDYRFGISGNYYTISVASGGPNRRFDPGETWRTDDFIVWTTRTDYFAAARAKIDAALVAHFKSSRQFPQDDAALNGVLAEAGIAPGRLRDGWGHPSYVVFKKTTRYSDHIQVYSYADYQSAIRRRTEITPVTQLLAHVTLRSAGEDGQVGTRDDFDLASYSRIVDEQTRDDFSLSPLPPADPAHGASAAPVPVLLQGATGAISGVVTDARGGVIANAKVKATNQASTSTYETRANDAGGYLLRNLPAGLYEVQFEAPGFSATVIGGVPVQSSNVTALDATLAVGTTNETVEVAAAAPSMQTQTNSHLSIDGAQVSGLPLQGRHPIQVVTQSGTIFLDQSTQLSTPRLREYFPETLAWQPSLETDAQGRAQLQFKLADNITTWKLAAIASTVDGEIGTVEKEVLAFQPFFIEHDPPRVLTEGDAISLPVVVRNYLDKTQTVDLECSPADWFTLTGPARKQTTVAAGDAARAIFDFRAVASIKDGAQRITASSAAANDAIEKRVSVHPDGEEMTATTTQIFNKGATLEINVPPNAIKNTARAEVKIYPNLMAHVVESVEAIMQRPYGCAEQTISAAYPSLLALRAYKQRGEDVPPIAQRARRYVQAAYERLLNYRDEQGGFSYWGRGNADLALTAYAIRFMTAAREFINVDEDVLQRSHTYLVSHQSEDGSWIARDWQGKADARRTAMLTSFVARVLAATESPRAIAASDKQRPPAASANLNRALDYLAGRAEEIDEPYLIASYALAAMGGKDARRVAQATAKLRRLARDEAGGAYWTLETNTPFYGWGLAGRVETTALVVQALAATPGNEDLINRGLVFLLRQKDRYSVWYTTQATINTLDALTSVLSSREANATQAGAPAAEIIVNGKRVASLAMPARDELSNPVVADVSEFLSTGSNRVEIRRAEGAPQATAQVITSHYAPWAVGGRQPASSALRFNVSYDKRELQAGEEVTCEVEAERVGFKGYGMMLAEIGLPPGADVDRASLERAMSASGWDINQYDVLPDRVIVYLWPHAGGTRFAFKFKPRFALNAQAAASVVYDYYNPEARVTVAPVRFVVR